MKRTGRKKGEERRPEQPARAGHEWYVYIVRCADRSLYTGIAKDCEQRLAEHNAGRGARYTRARLPVEIVYAEPAAHRSAALQRENAIKRLPRTAKLALIEGGPALRTSSG